jgi:hypothetical protein
MFALFVPTFAPFGVCEAVSQEKVFKTVSEIEVYLGPDASASENSVQLVQAFSIGGTLEDGFETIRVVYDSSIPKELEGALAQCLDLAKRAKAEKSSFTIRWMPGDSENVFDLRAKSGKRFYISCLNGV